ncbi:MAG: Ldh family oxidoreductase [Alphaproteobacteria bacterium]|nr:Ldh family oxidoreductase [Alphaproteobacteria bacterium]
MSVVIRFISIKCFELNHFIASYEFAKEPYRHSNTRRNSCRGGRRMSYSVNVVKTFSRNCFIAARVNSEHAEQISDNLVHADLRGIASHGLTRIPIYVERILRGVVKAAPQMKVLTDKGPLKLVDGDNASGAVASCFANALAIRSAKEFGICLVTVRNSNHNGIAAAYTIEMARAGLLGICATNVSKSMAIAGSMVPVLGTNPISFSVPRKGHEPIVLDMASSVVARGKIVEAAKRGDPIPEGWALDSEGQPTTDSVAAEKGVILPFSGVKGSGMALMVDMFSGVLANSLFGALIPNLYSNFTDPQRIGHFFLAIDPHALEDGAAFEDRVETFVGMIKSAKRAAGVDEILLPGEPEMRLEARRRVEGITLPPKVIADLNETAKSLGVPPLDRTKP